VPPLFEILIVEDNPGDVELVRQVLRESSTPHRLAVAKDGEEAMHMLRREGKYADAPRPHLILLDINLPKRSGHEVLQEMKADEALKTIPVVVFTSSASYQDIDQAFKYYANAYVQNPDHLNGYLNALQVIEAFWLKLSLLPSHSS